MTSPANHLRLLSASPDGPDGPVELDQLFERLKGTYEYAFVQKKMNYYPLAGIAHKRALTWPGTAVADCPDDHGDQRG